MFFFLACLYRPMGYQVGDHWIVERTIHHGFVVQTEQVSYRVEKSDLDKILILQVATKPGHPEAVNSRFNLEFSRDGVLRSDEPLQNANLMRLFRIEWTVVSRYAIYGCSWAWKAQKALGQGVVKVTNIGFGHPDTPLIVSYAEGSRKMGHGTAKIEFEPNAIQSFEFSFTPEKGAKARDSWSITEVLKDRTMRDSL